MDDDCGDDDAYNGGDDDDDDCDDNDDDDDDDDYDEDGHKYNEKNLVKLTVALLVLIVKTKRRNSARNCHCVDSYYDN